MSKKVQKALSPEEKTVLENIGSLVQQLMASGSSEIETDVMNAGIVPEDGEEEEDAMMAMKANMGPTANPEDKAEDRVEDPTDITAGNLSEVGKSLGMLLSMINGVKKSAQPVQKSAPAMDQTNVLVMKSLAEISNVMKSLADQQNQQNLAISNILDGLGFTEQIQKSLDVKKSSAPVGNLDGTMILSELTQVLKSLNGNQNQNNFVAPSGNRAWGDVRKSQHDDLRNAMPFIFGVNK